MMPTVALSSLTTIRVGGVPQRLVEPKTTDDLVDVCRAIWNDDEPWLLLAGGSNLVAADDGFDGTVIRIATHGVERLEAPAGTVRLRIQAGHVWDEVVEYAIESGLAGIETLSGIPGSAGAGPVQNIGAYGRELSSSLVAVDLLDAATGDIRRVPGSELELGYRTSSLKRTRASVVLALELDLIHTGQGRLGQSLPIAYPQLARQLGVQPGDSVPLGAAREAVLGLRRSKGMLVDPTDPDSASCGSFFVNPIVTDAFARSLPADAPRWPIAEVDESPVVVPLDAAPDDLVVATSQVRETEPPDVKLSAAWLIEHAGIARGFRLPGSAAAVSSKHTLAIVNTGDASAQEIVELARYIQTRVQAEFGVMLQPEPVLAGVSL